jgi:hypothetical protein
MNEEYEKTIAGPLKTDTQDQDWHIAGPDDSPIRPGRKHSSQREIPGLLAILKHQTISKDILNPETIEILGLGSGGPSPDLLAATKKAIDTVGRANESMSKINHSEEKDHINERQGAPSGPLLREFYVT